ncbi:uncharacterized protein LOC114292407 [Camellia sinensis]|uniref:uncharacterized protein LOC114292407 n=1 Tax=Camellia sinensis TaxID=4442 RepID=UPI00103625BF|nr:uncharacterized protein LOC114292407 [Camellia sinensis]
MRETHRLSTEEVIQFMVGLETDYFRVEGDYATFIQTHLMPPLAGVREGEGARAPTTRKRGRGTKATRSRRRRGSDERQRQGPGWPELPTSVTYQRRSGETCQIPNEPAPAGHALVGVRGPTPAPIEYTGQALELVASLTEMVQMSLDLPSLYRILPHRTSQQEQRQDLQFLSQQQRGEGDRLRHTAEVEPRASAARMAFQSPFLGDDDDETSEEAEAASPQFESSDGGDDDAGSNSSSSEAGEAEEGSSSGSDPALDSGDDGDSAPEFAPPRKRTKRAS